MTPIFTGIAPPKIKSDSPIANNLGFAANPIINAINPQKNKAIPQPASQGDSTKKTNPNVVGALADDDNDPSKTLLS